MSWWDLGENSGYSGSSLATYQIVCGFCNEQGAFETVHHQERRNKQGKVLNYDILKCDHCGNLTMVFWSAAARPFGGGLHDYKTVPWPRQTTTFPEHWPADVGRHWLQARRSLEGKNWDAASVMARSGVQLVMRHQKATGTNLKQEIESLASKGVLPPIMKEWSHEVRQLGNDSAHPAPASQGASENDAKDVVQFLTVLLQFTYDLPNQIEKFRTRKT